MPVLGVPPRVAGARALSIALGMSPSRAFLACYDGSAENGCRCQLIPAQRKGDDSESSREAKRLRTRNRSCAKECGMDLL